MNKPVFRYLHHFVLLNYLYFYIINKKREHRYKFRKDILISEGFDSNKTEQEIMSERGYNRIYDCGNLVYSISL